MPYKIIATLRDDVDAVDAVEVKLALELFYRIVAVTVEETTAQQSVQSDGACESCKLELTPSCPIRTGNGCDLYQPRR